MSARRGTSNTNSRGTTVDRRRRREWLVSTFGDGETVGCSFDGCDVVLTVDTVTADRWPVMGCDGGTYARGNIRPACAPHQQSHGGQVGNARRRAQAAS